MCLCHAYITLIHGTLYVVEEPVEKKSANIDDRARRSQDHDETQQIYEYLVFIWYGAIFGGELLLTPWLPSFRILKVFVVHIIPRYRNLTDIVE